MQRPLIPENEIHRLQYLKALEILDTPAEPEMDDVALLASQICQTQIALISLVDQDRQWFKARIGIDITESARDLSFCAHAILQNDPLVVEDAQQDKRFCDHPFVKGPPFIRFYAGAPLITPQGLALGTLCVIDPTPKRLTAQQRTALLTLARHVENQLRLRKTATDLSNTIVQRRSAERLQAESERLARATLDALTAQIAILDSDGKILSLNRRWGEWPLDGDGSLASLRLNENYLAVCDAAAQVNETMRQMAAGIRRVISGERQTYELEYACQTPTDGRWILLRVVRVGGEGALRVVASFEDVTERKAAEERIRHEALHDALTGLPNRMLFADRVCTRVQRAKRDPQSYFAVMFLDLDGFKIINDSLGHAAGDFILKAQAERLRTCLRSSDSVGISENVVARMGGDEFTVLLDSLNHPLDVGIVAERILRNFSRPISFEGHELCPSVSIGIAVSGGDYVYESAREMLRDADTAMYRAKSEGKDRYCVFDVAMHAAAVARLRLETDLRGALDRREFVLHYQPILSMKTGQLEGFEALIRWESRGEIYTPADFIKAAELSGLILNIGRWVITEAVRELASWRKANPSMGRISMSVNVSGKQLQDPDLVACVYDALTRHEVDPADLILEITESMLVENSSPSLRMLEDLKLLGVQTAIDDFGTGYSSLSCLHTFPINLLKIDRSFIKGLPARKDVAAVVRAVVTLAHQLGMKVVAEGLETAEQIECVRSLGADSGQGYFYSRPLTSSAAQAFIASKQVEIAA